MPQERIEVIFVAKGQRQVERSIVQMSKAADSLSKSVDKAAKSIGQMGKSSGGTGKVSKDTQKASRDVKKLGNDAQKTAGRVNSLWKSLIVPAATGASIRETGRAVNSLVGRFAAFYTGRVLIGISDEFGRLNNVLSGFGVASGEIDKVRKSINAVSNAARVDAVQAATLFGRLRQATQGLGLSSNELVQIVGTVNKALRLGGASSLEASQSIRQLSQAFNKGKLDGDEFRSVMENAPILQDLLTQKLGVTKDALFDLAAQGKITATDLVGAFQQGADAIDKAYGNRVTTLGDALTVLKNAFREAFGTQVSGPAKIIARAILSIARNMDRLVQAVSIFAGIKIFQAAIAGAKSLLSVIKAINIQSATGALAGLASGKGGIRTGTSAYNAANMTALMSQSSSKVAAGGTMAMMGGAAKGLGRAIPYVGWALIIMDVIPAVWDLVKSITGLGEATKKVETDLDRLNKYVQNQFLAGKGDPTRALPDVTLEAARRAAEIRDPVSARLGRRPFQQSDTRKIRIAGKLEAIRYETEADKLVNAATADANKRLSEAANRILSEVKLGDDSLVGFSEEDVRNYANDLEVLFKLLDTTRDLTGIERTLPRDFTYAGRLQGLFERELNVQAPDIGKLDITAGEMSGSELAKLIGLFREYRDAIPLTKQEKMGDSFNRAQSQAAEYRKRLDLLKDTSKKFKDKTEDLANAKAYLEENIRKLEDPLTQENKNLADQLSLLYQLASVKQLGNGQEVLGPSFESFTDEQKVALADQNTLTQFGLTLKTRGLDAAKKELDINIKLNKEIQNRMAPALASVKASEDAAAAEANRLQIIRSIRAETEAIGKTLQQQQSLLFVGTKEQDEYQSAIEAFNQTRRRDFVTSRLAELKSTVVELQQLQGRARQAGLPAEDQKVIGNIVNKLKSEVAGLGTAIAQVGGEAARPLLEETATFLKGKAGEVGTLLGSALARAFDAAVKSGAAPVSASGAVAAGQNPGSVGTFPTTDPTKDIANLKNGLSGVKSEIQQLKSEFDGFGSLVGTQLKQAGNAAQSTANEIQSFFESTFGTLEDALVEFVTTGEFDFKKFINAIIADLARLVIRMLIIRPLMNFFGGIFGFGFANGGLVGTDGTIKKYSTGGRVGGVGGTTSDNQLIMASRGEYVLNSATTRRIGAAYLDRLNSGGSPRSERRTVGSSTINFAPQITVVNDGGSDRDGQQQGEQIGTMVRQSFTELLMKETRPGGMLESVNRKGFA